MKAATKQQASTAIIFCAVLWLLSTAYRMASPSEPRTYTWSSKLEGWYARAHTHTSPRHINFNTAKILMASHYNAMGGDGFNMALFELDSKERLAVDAKGQVLILDTEDATAIITLLDKSLTLPTHEYRIWHLISCRPFDIVNVASGDAFERFSIYGFRKSMRDLEDQAGQLPDALWELYGVIEEARSQSRHKEKDEDVLKAVKERVQFLG